MIRRTLVLAAAATGLALAAATSALAAQPYPVNFRTFDLSKGAPSGVAYANGALTLATTGLVGAPYVDPYAGVNGDGVDGSGSYVSGSWVSPDVSLTFGFDTLVSSWNATTPTGTWVQSEVQPKLDDGHWGKWYVLGRWTSGDSDFHRTSVGGQGDADGYVAIDTFLTKDHPAVAYRLRLTLFRRTTTTASPSVTRFSAVASAYTNQKGSFPSKTTMTGTDIDLHVPQYSQEIHHGEYPQYDNGGEAWCSPTSTAMVVAYWAKLYPARHYQPSTTETAWVNPAYADPVVDFTARAVYDYHYNGAGNWPFNTAYAASRGLVADVTELHNLAEAEAFVKAGIPLVASINFTSNKLPGADIKSTDGHLVVIVGFSGDGSLVYVNDPASPDDASVEHAYGREAFERAWVDGSGGIVYVDRPADVRTPSLTANNG